MTMTGKKLWHSGEAYVPAGHLSHISGLDVGKVLPQEEEEKEEVEEMH